MLRARITAMPVKAEKDRDFASVQYGSSPVAGKILCSRSAGISDSANDREQFRLYLRLSQRHQ